MTLEKFFTELGDEEKPLKHAGLLQLSGLPSEDMVEFKAVWHSMPQSRKREILAKLVELGENNIELDFHSVFRACLTDGDEYVREQATRGLWDCEDRVVIRPLIETMRADPSEKVRAAAAMTLAKFAARAQEGKLATRDAERIREALLETIGDEKERLDVRRRAIEAIAAFNSPEVEQIIRDAYNSEDSSLKQSAIYAMGRSSDTRWLPIVLKETHHQDAAVRYEAANASGQLGDESTVPHLIRLIKDEDTQVQLSAVQALGNIGGPLAKQALLQCLKSGDESIEEAAQAALANLDFDEDPLNFRFDN